MKEIIGKARGEGRYKLLEHESYEVLRYYGLPAPKFGLASSSSVVLLNSAVNVSNGTAFTGKAFSSTSLKLLLTPM